MANTPYMQGDYAEKLVCDHLKAHGYLPFQARGSRGIADIVAVKPRPYGPSVVLAQVKRDTATPHASWNALYELARAYGCIPVWVDDYQPGAGARPACFRWREIRGWHEPHRQAWPAREFRPDAD